MLMPLLVAAMMTQSDPVAVPPRPKGPPSHMVDDDAPAGERPTGPTKVVLTVDRRGRVEACRIVETSGGPLHDRLACRVMTRLTFHPARTAAGKAVAAEFETRMHWDASKR